MPENAGSPHLGETSARQGRRGLPVLWLLVLSTVMGLVVVAAVWMAMSGRLSRANRTSGPTAGDASSFHTPPPPPSTN